MSTCKIFADDTSLFSFVHNKYGSRDELNHDLKKKKDWSLNWKKKLNPDPNKQA